VCFDQIQSFEPEIWTNMLQAAIEKNRA
jgi:hypothetical protein